MEVGAWEENLGTLNMTDGVINITQGLYCPSAWDGTGRVNLRGGTINARYIFMNDTIRTTGSIDIGGGKFILSRGNEVEELTDYSNGIGTIGLGAVSLTAYGVGDGDIITDDVNYPAALGKRADLSIDYDVSNEGKTTVQAFTTDPNQAWNPSPPNGAGNAKGTVANIKRPVLKWSAGDGAASHEVYFGTNETLVSARDVSVRKQTAYSPSSWTVDSDLTSFQTYYWAIDENPGPTLGQVWDFTMANLAKAGPPSPENGATDVSPAVNLSWGAGIYAVTHDVYFSTDFTDVNDRDPCSLTNRPTNDYDPPGNGLEFSTTYYWRVDEVNASGGAEWPGDIWSFTTDDHLVVDDMESYDVSIDLIADTWLDVWTISICKAEILINYADPILAIDGNSMEFNYNNNAQGGNKRKYSWTEALASDLGAGTNWTISGLKALVLNFYGQSGNSANPLYVVVEDGSTNEAMVTYDDANAILEEKWHEWNIDLEDFNGAGVDLTDVNKITLGIGVRGELIGGGQPGGGTGTVYFDSFELWPRRCVASFTAPYGDFDEDCVVDELDLDIIVGEWLKSDASLEATAPSDVNLVARWEFEGNYNDSNGSNHGLNYGDVTTVYDAGRDQYVLSCDGTGDYVEIPGSNTPGGVFDITSDITLSAWVKFSVMANNWPAIIAKGDDTESWRLTRAGKAKDAEADAIEFCASGVYLVEDGWENPYGNVVGSVPVADGLWHHTAGVYDGSKICVYVDGIVDTCKDCSGSFNSSTYNVWIGANPVSLEGWTGEIDDVRVYNAALQPGEIAVLAGFEGTVYAPLTSPANLSPKVGPYGWDPNNLDIVDFLDYNVLAERWLELMWFP
jgi:hypothetical protein